MNKSIAFAVMAAFAASATCATAQTVDIYASKADYRDGVLTSVPAASLPKAGGDDCTAPPSITAPLPFVDTGDTTGAPSTHDLIPLACNGNYTSVAGPDHVYAVDLAVGNNVTFSVAPQANFDPSIYLLSTCSDPTSCISGADNSFGTDPTPESFAVSGLAAGTYFFFVDSFYSAPGGAGGLPSGPYTLTVTGTLPVELMEFSVD